MTSIAQAKANQNNARKSTGPKTPAGKAKSSQNALTHGIYAAIPLLPGENQDKLSQLADDINAAFAPTDAMEVSIVERIIIGTIRQIRLREAEAAKLRISMSDHVIAERIGTFFRHPLSARSKSEHVSDHSEQTYQYFVAVIDEYENYIKKHQPVTLLNIQENTPHIYELMTDKPVEYNLSWDEFAKDKIYLSRALTEIKEAAKAFIVTNGHFHQAYQFKADMKIASRIPQGDDMALFSKYQIQLDTDIYRAMDALRKYREGKAKIIEAEVINE
jgi:hypothetical protein